MSELTALNDDDAARFASAFVDRLYAEIAALRIQVSLREREREAWQACADQLATDLRTWCPPLLRAKALAKYEQLSRPDSDYVWPE